MSNTVLTITKLAGGLITGSVSILSEGIHSAVDLVASLMAFFSVRYAGKPADSRHQFGHGKIENISGTIEGLLIFVAGGYIIYEAVRKILTGVEIVSLDLGIGIMGGAAVVNFLVSRHLHRVAKKEDSIAIEADAWHLLTDVYTSLGVFTGLVLVRLTGITVLDPIIAIGMALLIIKAAYQITRKAVRDLLDASLPENEINVISEIVNAHRGEIVGFQDLLSRKSGGERFIHLTLTLPYFMAVSGTHEICNRIEGEISQKLANCHIIIHSEPCVAHEAGQCPLDCPARRVCEQKIAITPSISRHFREEGKGFPRRRGRWWKEIIGVSGKIPEKGIRRDAGERAQLLQCENMSSTDTKNNTLL
jgi:cation diffusion facilitator family transporter